MRSASSRLTRPQRLNIEDQLPQYRDRVGQRTNQFGVLTFGHSIVFEAESQRDVPVVVFDGADQQRSLPTGPAGGETGIAGLGQRQQHLLVEFFQKIALHRYGDMLEHLPRLEGEGTGADSLIIDAGSGQKVGVVPMPLPLGIFHCHGLSAGPVEGDGKPQLGGPTGRGSPRSGLVGFDNLGLSEHKGGRIIIIGDRDIDRERGRFREFRALRRQIHAYRLCLSHFHPEALLGLVQIILESGDAPSGGLISLGKPHGQRLGGRKVEAPFGPMAAGSA